MSHTEQLNGRLRRMRLGVAPSPWSKAPIHGIGGLTEVGYVPGTDMLLAVSSSGRGLFDCLTGQRIARDYTPPDEGHWYDETGLLAQGIGPVEQQIIRLAGLHGGGLPWSNREGWSLERIAPDWPLESIVIQPAGCSVLVERFAEGCAKIEEDHEIRAFGFSDTGRTFVIALSHSLVIHLQS